MSTLSLKCGENTLSILCIVETRERERGRKGTSWQRRASVTVSNVVKISPSCLVVARENLAFGLLYSEEEEEETSYEQLDCFG